LVVYFIVSMMHGYSNIKNRVLSLITEVFLSFKFCLANNNNVHDPAFNMRLPFRNTKQNSPGAKPN